MKKIDINGDLIVQAKIPLEAIKSSNMYHLHDMTWDVVTDKTGGKFPIKITADITIIKYTEPTA